MRGRRLLAAVLLAWPLVAARAQAPVPPADLLTDVSDDGSLVAGLSDADAHVRLVAARGLSRLLLPAETGAALRQRALSEQDADVLAAILFALAQRKDADAAPLLADLLGPQGHADPRVRAAACFALGRLGDGALAAPLVVRLADNDSDVRGAAALALYRLDRRGEVHERPSPETVLAARDAALTGLLLRDADAGVRWRAACALGGVRGRRGMATALQLATRDAEPLVRVFALRGLAALQREGLGLPFDPRPALGDPDERVVVEAAHAAAVLGTPNDARALLAGQLADSPSGLVRATAADALGERLGAADDETARLAISDALADAARRDGSPMVRRAAAAALVAGPDDGRALYFLHALSRGSDPRDRARAAVLLREGPRRDSSTLLTLLADRAPSVVAEALGTLVAKGKDGAPLYDLPHDAVVERLVAALGSDEPEPRADAAEAVLPEALDGTLDPRVVHACALSLLSATGPEMKEAAQALRRALGLPPDSAPPASPPPGRLLDRLLAQDVASRADPHPRVRLATTRGDVLIELDRVDAPVHVASFLELVDKGCYDGLDFHRVVPNFVVQGLDPRGDGFGTGGRRLPDEFSPQPYLTGTLGMPNAGEPDTGGCQIFLTHVPTPHLDGRYTVFGRVIEGQGVVQRLEIGDEVTKVTRE